MRIDAHQHFWCYNAREYGWIGLGMDVLKQDYLPERLSPLLQEAGIDGTIAVQARQTLGETAWLLELAERYPFIRGVVGWVDLCSSRVEQQLYLFAKHPRLVGVRHVLEDEPDDRFMLGEAFQRGIAALAPHGLTYDLLTRPRHLPLAYELVSRFPEQTFVLDHISKPPIEAGTMEPWATDLRRLAGLDNVVCKVSGMVTEADRQHWQPEDLRPYLDTVWDAFGPRRLLLGSDWPVCTLAADYGQVVGIVTDYVDALAPQEREAVLGENAGRVYGIGDAA